MTSAPPSSSCSLEPPSTARLFPGAASKPVFFKKVSESPPKKRCSSSPAAPARKPHHKPTLATVTKMGRRRGDLANRLDQRSFFAWILCQRASGNREQQTGSSPGRRCCWRSRRMTYNSPPDDPSLRSSKAEEVTDCN